MSVFSNPSSRSAAQAGAYTSAVLQLLADRDPMDVLGATAASLSQSIDGLTDADIAAPEAAGKWSMRQVLQHLADSELVWGYRLRMVLAQDRPSITGYDQDQWAQRLRYHEADSQQSIADFATLRNANLRLLAHATEADLQRVGIHAERGEESVGHMIRLYAGHDLLHLRQLARIRQSLPGRQSLTR